MTLGENSNNLNIKADQKIQELKLKDEKNEEESSIVKNKDIDQPIYTTDKNSNETGYSFEIGV